MNQKLQLVTQIIEHIENNIELSGTVHIIEIGQKTLIFNPVLNFFTEIIIPEPRVLFAINDRRNEIIESVSEFELLVVLNELKDDGAK